MIKNRQVSPPITPVQSHDQPCSTGVLEKFLPVHQIKANPTETFGFLFYSKGLQLSAQS